MLPVGHFSVHLWDSLVPASPSDRLGSHPCFPWFVWKAEGHVFMSSLMLCLLPSSKLVAGVFVPCFLVGWVSGLCELPQEEWGWRRQRAWAGG